MSGPAATLACRDDNSLLRELVQQPGEGRILVVDGQASTHRALLGDIQAARAMQNGWAGLLVHGYVRDRLALAKLPFPIFALGTVPLRPLKQRTGEVGGTLRFLNLTISPGMWVYADPDGVIVLNRAVSVPSEALAE
jgi:regulator of ribonuclease activity A